VTATFPVLWQGGANHLHELERFMCPREVPLWIVQQHETQAMRHHGGQSLAELARRGGLAPCELVAVLDDRPWRPMSVPEAVAALHDHVTACPTDELTEAQISMARVAGVLEVDENGLGWVPRRWAARVQAGGDP